MASVLVSGIAVVDFVLGVNELPTRADKYRAESAEIIGGGCAANAAVAIARLGGTAHLVSRVGADPLAELILSDLRAEGVDCALTVPAPGARSSFSAVLVDGAGERQIVNFRGQGLPQDPPDLTSLAVQAVLVDTRWPKGAAAALELARARGIPGVLDAEPPLAEDLLTLASHVAFSREGLTEFAGTEDLHAGLAHTADALAGWVCVTDGANGTYWFDKGATRHCPAFDVPVRDTLAAGDVWHGAFALALAEGQPEAGAVRFANAAAALKCMTFGGRKGAPGRKAVEDFLKETTG